MGRAIMIKKYGLYIIERMVDSTALVAEMKLVNSL